MVKSNAFHQKSNNHKKYITESSGLRIEIYWKENPAVSCLPIQDENATGSIPYPSVNQQS